MAKLREQLLVRGKRGESRTIRPCEAPAIRDLEKRQADELTNRTDLAGDVNALDSHFPSPKPYSFFSIPHA